MNIGRQRRGHTKSNQSGSDRSGRWMVAWSVGQFTFAGLVAMAIVAFATTVASRRVGEREAITDARTTTLARAQNIVEPAVTDALIRRDAVAVAALDRVVRSSVLDRNLVRVKIWSRDGTIVYSDEPRLISARYSLGADEHASLNAGRIDAGVSDLSKPENRFERDQGKLLEVYLRIRAPGGEPLLFEAYFRYAAVAASGGQVWRSFAPVTLGAVIVLELVQIPLAWRLARRLRQRQRERESLLQKALDASDTERRRIASDLHDGVVQDLAGVAYSLAGVARHNGLSSDATRRLEESASEVRTSIKALRSLLVEIYPPNLAEAGLRPALADLLARAETRGLRTRLDVDGRGDSLPDAAAALVYRAAQEGLRNVLTHANARMVNVRVCGDGERVVLDVEDDGVGFHPDASAAASGHIGLRGLRDLVTDAGGVVEVRSSPGVGTRLHVEVPVP